MNGWVDGWVGKWVGEWRGDISEPQTFYSSFSCTSPTRHSTLLPPIHPLPSFHPSTLFPPSTHPLHITTSSTISIHLLSFSSHHPFTPILSLLYSSLSSHHHPSFQYPPPPSPQPFIPLHHSIILSLSSLQPSPLPPSSSLPLSPLPQRSCSLMIRNIVSRNKDKVNLFLDQGVEGLLNEVGGGGSGLMRWVGGGGSG